MNSNEGNNKNYHCYYVSTPVPAATDHATGLANRFTVGGSFQNAGGLQVALPTAAGAATPAWSDGTVLQITLGGAGNGVGAPPAANVTFAKVPTTVSISSAPITATQLDTRAGFNGSHATAATPVATTAAAKADWKVSASLNADRTVLTVALPKQADAPVGTTAGVYLVSLGGIRVTLWVQCGISTSRQPPPYGVRICTMIGSPARDAEQLRNPPTLSPYHQQGVLLPSVVITESAAKAFVAAGDSFTVQVTGTDVDATHKVGFVLAALNSITGASTTSGKTVGNAAVTAGDTTATITLSGADDTKLESIAASGLKVVNAKPGTDITLSIILMPPQ